MILNFSIHYRTVWGESLGVMIADQVIPLATTDGEIWSGSADVELPQGGLPLPYRYGVWRDGQCIRQERNVMAHVIERVPASRRSLQLDDQWRDARRVAGVAVPIFSLRSEGSYGVGDFGDLRLLIDWAVMTHQGAVQILPINDTTITQTWQDSYPYNSISIYALHPQYADLRQLPALLDEAKARDYEARRRELNALAQIDYEAVNQAKRAYLHDIFEQEGTRCLSSAGFRTFFAQNEEWLRPYAAFSVLRDQYGTPDFQRWPSHSQYDKAEIEALTSPRSPRRHEVRYYYYVQYVLHTQLLAASAYARQQGVILKGDIPIGISRASVEAWVEPFYFNMNGSAGAPPDPFSANGQNWGFPTYNWDAMQRDGLRWWLRRFRKMQEYFSAYRIDHLLGFFRIWEIPTHSVHGLLGQFAPSLPMTPDEIQSYGLAFDPAQMARPLITDELLELRFSPLRHYSREEPGCWEGKDVVQYVRDTFLDRTHDDRWQMKGHFATQRQVEGFFSGKRKPRNLELREAIYTLISDVLFVEDHRRPGTWHPRISAQMDYAYSRLQWWEKEAFDRLYNEYFYRRHNQFWYEQAMQKLPALVGATQMIVCGEDLGMVPDCVPWVMNQLQILSLEIQRMPKNPQDAFGHVYWYPERSVCTTGSHDTETLRQWWELDPAQTRRYYYDELHEQGECPATATPEICARIILDHLYSPSLLCILPLQDWLSIDGTLRLADTHGERINIPANPRHYWRYRMHLTLEELMRQTAFNERLAQMITDANR